MVGGPVGAIAMVHADDGRRVESSGPVWMVFRKQTIRTQ